MLARNKKFNTLKKFLTNMERSTHVFVYSTTLAEEKEVVNTALQKTLTFDDAMQYYVAQKMGCGAIVSFDPDFDKTGLKRKTPKEAMKE